MSCNCKKPQVLNNTNSKDHLKLLFKVYEEVIDQKKVEDYSEPEQRRVMNVFTALYPNVKQIPTLEHAVKELIKLYQQKK